MTQAHTLLPFNDENLSLQDWENFDLTVTLERSPSYLDLRYRLQGAISELVCPDLDVTPTRQNNLWESTCFEFFLSPNHSIQYHEVNLSPSGHWNIYQFEDYRQGMTEAREIESLEYQTTRSPSELILACRFPLTPLGLHTTPLDLSITAVLLKQTGATGYWATAHVASQADFHQRDSFMIQV